MAAYKTKGAALLAVSAGLYLATPLLLSLMTPQASATALDSMAKRQARNASAFAIMLGEFRTSIGDMLFVKTERYLDSGIGYEPHIDEGQLAQTGSADETEKGEAVFEAELLTPKVQEGLAIKPGSVDSHDHAGDHEHEGHDDHGHDDHDHDSHDAHGHDDHDHDSHEAHSHDDHDHAHADHAHEHEDSAVETLIRTADRDFRGFIGHLEREVKPWRDPSEPHKHTAGTELLPWYRLATLSDPYNVRNYMIGAWWLKTLRTPEQLQEALEFLDEGIAANPNAYELYLMKGYVLKDMEQTGPAMEQFAKSADLAIEQRPAGGPDSTPEWDLTDDEQMAAAMSMHIILTRDTVSTGSALQLTNEYIRRMPTEGSLQRLKSRLESGN